MSTGWPQKTDPTGLTKLLSFMMNYGQFRPVLMFLWEIAHCLEHMYLIWCINIYTEAIVYLQ